MSNENKVKEKYPNAYADKYKTQGFGAHTYWLIWSDSKFSNDKKRLGEGETSAQAWRDAFEFLTDIEEL